MLKEKLQFIRDYLTDLAAITKGIDSSRTTRPSTYRDSERIVPQATSTKSPQATGLPDGISNLGRPTFRTGAVGPQSKHSDQSGLHPSGGDGVSGMVQPPTHAESRGHGVSASRHSLSTGSEDTLMRY